MGLIVKAMYPCLFQSLVRLLGKSSGLHTNNVINYLKNMIVEIEFQIIGDEPEKELEQTENGINRIIVLSASDGGPAGAKKSVVCHFHKLIFRMY